MCGQYVQLCHFKGAVCVQQKDWRVRNEGLNSEDALTDKNDAKTTTIKQNMDAGTQRDRVPGGAITGSNEGGMTDGWIQSEW